MNTRRTPWQIAAAKRYPKMLFVGGDSTDPDHCWIVLTKCKHQQTNHWRYVLRTTEAEAQALLDHWLKERCNPLCQGPSKHSHWRIRKPTAQS